MTAHKIEVSLKEEFPDPEAVRAAALLRSGGAASLKRLRASRVYEISGALTIAQLHRVGRELLADPVTQEFRVLSPSEGPEKSWPWRIEVWLKLSVSDPAEDTVKDAVAALGFPRPQSVRIGSVFSVESRCARTQIESAALRGLIHPAVHRLSVFAS